MLNSLAFGVIAMPAAAVAIALAVYLPRHYASHLGLDLAAVGSAFFLVRLIDIPIDALLGWAMDRTRTPIGRYRAWLIAGAPVMIVGLYMLFLASPGVTKLYLVAALLVTYLGNSILTLAGVAWASNLAPRYNDRSRLFGVLTALGVIASAAVIAIPIFNESHGVSDTSSVPTMGRFMMILTPIAVALAVIRTPERVMANAEGSHFRLRDFGALIARPTFARLLAADLCLALGPGWMSASYLFFFTDSRGFTTGQASLLLGTYILAGIVGAPLMARLAMRISKHRAVMVASTGYALILCSTLLIPRGSVPVGAAILFTLGVLASGFNVLTRAMTADVADEVRLDQGQERAALLFALTTMTQKIAGAISIGLTFFVLAKVGYNAAEGAANTAQSIHRLEIVYLAGPTFFILLGGAFMLGYTLDAARHGEIRRQLEIRDGLWPPAGLGENEQPPPQDLATRSQPSS